MSISLPTVSKLRPDIVYLHIGSTDLTIGKSPSDIAEQMKMLVTVLLDTFHVKHVLVAKVPWLPYQGLNFPGVQQLNELLTNQFDGLQEGDHFYGKTSVVCYREIDNQLDMSVLVSRATHVMTDRAALAMYNGIRHALLSRLEL